MDAKAVTERSILNIFCEGRERGQKFSAKFLLLVERKRSQTEFPNARLALRALENVRMGLGSERGIGLPTVTRECDHTKSGVWVLRSGRAIPPKSARSNSAFADLSVLGERINHVGYESLERFVLYKLLVNL